jgi:hypothetical protein
VQQWPLGAQVLKTWHQMPREAPCPGCMFSRSHIT